MSSLPLLMIQVKHGRWFLMLNSPTSIYYKKMDASSSIEQPRANSLQMASVPGMGIFHHRMLHHKVQPYFQSWPSFLLSSYSFLPCCLLPPFFFLYFFFISCVPTQEEYTKETDYGFVPGGIDNKFKETKTWNIKWFVDRDKCRVRKPNLYS